MTVPAWLGVMLVKITGDSDCSGVGEALRDPKYLSLEHTRSELRAACSLSDL